MEDKIVISLCDKTGHMVLPWAEAGYKCLCIDTQHPERMRKHPLHENIIRWGTDILDDRVGQFISDTREDIVFMSCFPPCTDLTGAGARWWKEKGDEAYEFAMKLVYRCDLLGKLSGAPYFIENPPGRIASGAGCTMKPHPMKWRKWDYRFQPFEYGGWHGKGLDWWRAFGGREERFDKIGDSYKNDIDRAHAFTKFCSTGSMPEMPNDGYTKSTCLWVGGGFVMPEKRQIPLNENHNMIHMCAPGPERANIRSVTPMGFAYAVYDANKI
jgi:hypothetical protein